MILTRGSIAGLEAVGGAPRWIKTDAWIGLGHSGGSLLDSGMRLVGVPAAAQSDGSGEPLLGFDSRCRGRHMRTDISQRD